MVPNELRGTLSHMKVILKWIIYEGDIHRSTVDCRASRLALASISFRMGDGVAEYEDDELITWGWIPWG
eukprot:12925762-Prorocentrum_lima.AAC.1